MKRVALLALLLLVAVPGFSAAKKITVADLKDMLATMHTQNKSDEEVSNALKQIVLTEQLDRTTMNNFADQVPGTLSTEQIYVLEARSATAAAARRGRPRHPRPRCRRAAGHPRNKAATYTSGTWGQLPSPHRHQNHPPLPGQRGSPGRRLRHARRIHGFNYGTLRESL